jgi:AcrR family transcriptional regulator
MPTAARPRPTTPATRWRRRKEARPAEILDAALACFAERGFAATRLDDVAKRAGITKGTLYLYFPNKEELFKAVVRQAIVASIARGEALVAESADPAPVLLERLVRQWSELIPTPASAIPKLMLAEAGNFPELARFYLEEVVSRGRELIRGVIRKAIERREFRSADLETSAYCVMAPLVLAMQWRHSFAPHDSETLDAKALADTHVQLLLRGLVGEGRAAPQTAASDAAGDEPMPRRKGASR